MTEFNKFAYVIKAIRDRAAVSGNDVSGAEFELFGYPDWTAYRGEALDTLHKLGATVYSRFFDDFNSFDSRTLQSNFRRWYGHSIIEVSLAGRAGLRHRLLSNQKPSGERRRIRPGIAKVVLRPTVDI